MDRPLVRRLGVSKIQDAAEKRLQLYQDRDAWYDKLLRYYFGDQQEGKTYSPTILPANAQGRPLLRQVGESINVNRAYNSHRLAPIVDDYAGLLGRMPNSRVDPPDQSQQGEAKANLLTQYLYSTYELSNMATQQAEAGFYQSGLGDAVYMLEPEPNELRVVWNVVSPRSVYPRFWHGYRRFEVYDLITIEVWDEDEIETQLNHSPKSDSPDDCTVLLYMSPYQRTILLGNSRPEIVKHVEWDLGFCPAAWLFNKVTGRMGMSDIGHSLGQQDFLDWSFNVWADGLVNMTYPIVVIKDPINMGQDQITIGPGAPPVPVMGSGDVKAITTGADPRAIEAIMNQTLQDISTTTGSSPVRQEGQMHGSIITGRAVHAVQGPQSTRIDGKQDVMAAVWRQLNRMTLAMQEKAPHLKDFNDDIHGRYKGQSFQTRFNAKADIDGWYRNTVRWEQLVGLNQQQKLQVAYEGIVAKIWDDLHAREMVGVDDPIGMRERIRAMMLSEMQMQEGAAGGAGQPGTAPGDSAGSPAAGQTPGVQSPQQPPPQIFRPPAMMPGPQQQQLPTGVPMGVSRDAVKKALEKVASNLKGTAYAIGELATKGQAEHASVAVTDSRDFNRVQEALRAIDPGAKVRKIPEDKLPAEAVRVA